MSASVVFPHTDMAKLQVAVQMAEPSAFLVEPRILRRVIKQDRRLASLGIHVPHQHCYTIQRDRLLVIVDRSELKLSPAAELPKTVILLAEPTEGEAFEGITPAELLHSYWRLLFHARVHTALEQRVAERKLDDDEAFRLRRDIGATEFDEIHHVLMKDDLLISPATDLDTYLEFVAVYLELRYFAPQDLPLFFPAIRDWAAIDRIVSRDVDHERLYWATRLADAPIKRREPNPLDEREAAAVEGGSLSGALRASPARVTRWLARADRARLMGNGVKAAIWRTRAQRLAAPEEAARLAHAADQELADLVERMRVALRLPDDAAAQFVPLLAPLLKFAARDRLSPEARLLYDLQKVCLEQERGVYRVDIWGWARSLGKQPLRRPLPLLRQVMITKHLRSAARRIPTLRIPVASRDELAHRIEAAFQHMDSQMRADLRPLIAGVLDEVDLVPENVPQRVARRKIIEEQLDRIVDRGYLTMGDLRDALSQNNLKLSDISSVWQGLTGDQLLRADRKLARVLDGIYRPGAAYLRWPQRLSSLAFGTPSGRFLTQYVVLPYGSAFLAIEGLHHILEKLEEGAEVVLEPIEADQEVEAPGVLDVPAADGTEASEDVEQQDVERQGSEQPGGERQRGEIQGAEQLRESDRPAAEGDPQDADQSLERSGDLQAGAGAAAERAAAERTVQLEAMGTTTAASRLEQDGDRPELPLWPASTWPVAASQARWNEGLPESVPFSDGSADASGTDATGTSVTGVHVTGANTTEASATGTVPTPGRDKTMFEAAHRWAQGAPQDADEITLTAARTAVPPASPGKSAADLAGHPWQLDLLFFASVLALGTLILLLIHRPPFRRWIVQQLIQLWKLLQLVLVQWPTRLIRSPLVQRILQSQAYGVVRSYLLRPAVFSSLVLLPLSVARGWDWSFALNVFLAFNLFLNSPIGRYADERITDVFVRAWHELRIRVFAAAFHWVMDAFQQFIETVERWLYMVDEWLRFRRGDSTFFLWIKGIVGALWSVVRYVVRFCVTLLIEPQVNPIKHFPVVTVSHKILLPLTPQLVAATEPFLGKLWAGPVAAALILLLPGVCGFLVWELKGNWRLFGANRSTHLVPNVIGHHGETMVGLLRPGFHSGTIPKLFGRLRRAARRSEDTGNRQPVQQRITQLHHIEESVRHFFDRELCALLEEDGTFAAPNVHTGRMHLATNRIDLELRRGHRSSVWLALEERGGWLTACIRHRGWIEELSEAEQTAWEAALAGIYKMAGVDLVHEQLDAGIGHRTNWYDITEAGIAVYTGGSLGSRVLYPLRRGRNRVAPESEIRALRSGWPVFRRDMLVFGDANIPWTGWVYFWAGQKAESDWRLAAIGGPNWRLAQRD